MTLDVLSIAVSLLVVIALTSRFLVWAVNGLMATLVAVSALAFDLLRVENSCWRLDVTRLVFHLVKFPNLVL